MKTLRLLTLLVGLLALSASNGSAAHHGAPPMNFVVIFVDDLGYADIEPFGSLVNRTPHLNRMAAEGRKFTSFYVGAPVCTPSRAALLTGCYPQRVDMGLNALPTSVNNIVLFPGDPKGLNPSEITIAEILKEKGYATACIGKWHLGDQPGLLPTDHGFDRYLGIPFSNDMGFDNSQPYPPLPLMRDDKVIEEEPDQRYLTKRCTEETLAFIEENQSKPFFAYVPHSMVHWPHYASPDFEGKSKNGIYGDVVEEIDWSVGQILNKLKDLNLEERTMVLFTSDNGGGGARGNIVSNLPLRARKGNLCEGGIRVCTLAWGLGLIPGGTVCHEMVTAMDLLPTFAHLAGATVPSDRILDGKNITPLLKGEPGATTPHEAFFYRRGLDLYAVRSGPWKLFVKANQAPYPGQRNSVRIEPGTLYHLERDLGETTNVAMAHPDVVARLEKLAEAARDDIGDGTDRRGQNVRPAAYIDPAKAKPLTAIGESHGFISMFDGTTLEGWRADPDTGDDTWQVKDGVIHGEGQEDRLAYLVYAKDEDLRNFEMKFDYRMVTKGNTGVEVRTRVDETGKRPFEGYHADLGHVGIGPGILGAWDFHFGHDTRKEHPCPRGTRLIIRQDDTRQSQKIRNELTAEHIVKHAWNECTIIARGSRFQLFINRKLASEFTDNHQDGQLERGFVGLQLHDKGMIVQFKDLYLKKLED